MFILAKLIPFWIIGFIAITIGFLVAWAVYGLIPLGYLHPSTYLPPSMFSLFPA